MEQSDFQKNRTVKTESKHLASQRKGRKIPKTILTAETQASNSSTGLDHPYTSMNTSLYVAPSERSRFTASMHLPEISREEAQRILNDAYAEYAQLREMTQLWSSGVSVIPSNFVYGNHEYRE